MNARRVVKREISRWRWHLLILSISWTSMGFFTLAGASEPITLSYSTFFPAKHVVTDISADWAKEVEKRTNGKIKINIYPGETLTKAAQTYDGVVRGIADIGLSCLVYTLGRFPLMEVTDLPLGISSCRQGSHMAWEIYKKFRPEEFNDTKLLYLFTSCPGLFQTRKPVEKLEDLSGLRIRCTGGNAPMVKALGGTPLAIPMPETYISLQKGIADGTLCPYESLKGFKLGEVIKYTTEYGVYATTFFVAMNLAKWNSLAPETQKALEAVSEEWVDVTGKRWDADDIAGKEYSLKLNNQVITLPAKEQARWKARFQPILDTYISEKTAKGLPAKTVLDEASKIQQSLKFDQ